MTCASLRPVARESEVIADERASPERVLMKPMRREVSSTDRPSIDAALRWPSFFPVRPACSVATRSAERRVGKVCVSTCRTSWSADHKKKQKYTTHNTAMRLNKHHNRNK